MNNNKIILYLTLFLLASCADYNTIKKSSVIEKKYYSSKGFALIYEEKLFIEKIIDKKIKDDDLLVVHNFLKKNTPIQLTNPSTSKVYNTKVYKTANYPEIFNIVITKKLASFLELDPNNPYVEINEVKKNKTFIAKQSDTYDEEKNVAEKAPVDEIKMDDLSKNTQTTSNKKAKKYEFVLVIADFYYLESAHRLKNELSSQISMNNFFVNKLTDNSYRLAIGPFKNFNALKSTYISLNNLGFGNLNIQRILK